MPTRRLPSAAIAISPNAGKRGAGSALKKLSTRFRSLPVPVIGHIEGGAFLLDLRCLEDVEGFVRQLEAAP